MSVQDYLQTIKSLADSLSAINQPVSDPDLVLYALGGLGHDYESFITSITARDNPPTFDGLRPCY